MRCDFIHRISIIKPKVTFQRRIYGVESCFPWLGRDLIQERFCTSKCLFPCRQEWSVHRCHRDELRSSICGSFLAGVKGVEMIEHTTLFYYHNHLSFMISPFHLGLSHSATPTGPGCRHFDHSGCLKNEKTGSIRFMNVKTPRWCFSCEQENQKWWFGIGWLHHTTENDNTAMHHISEKQNVNSATPLKIAPSNYSATIP